MGPSPSKLQTLTRLCDGCDPYSQDLEKEISKVRPHHEITDIRELQPGQMLRGAGRSATTFCGVRGGWSGIIYNGKGPIMNGMVDYYK